MQIITIIDYGMGNLKSISTAIYYSSENVNLKISDNPNEIKNSDKIILPGVGHFGTACSNIDKLGLREVIRFMVTEKQTPILGICLGMQLLFNKSEEANSESKGLGFFNEDVKKLKTGNERVPHVGFNHVNFEPSSQMSKNLTSHDFYFVHNYGILKKPNNGIVSIAKHNSKIIASIEHNNIWGTQFHPEKSQRNGLQLLGNFLNL